MKTIQMTVLGVLGAFLLSTAAVAGPPVKSKFYNFKNQLIDGQRVGPDITLVSRRDRVKFARLLSLKKSFMRTMFQTQKERVFK